MPGQHLLWGAPSRTPIPCTAQSDTTPGDIAVHPSAHHLGQRRLLLLLLPATALAVTSLPSAAQTWPTKPVSILVPSTPGGAIDSYARTVAEQLARQFKQPFVVENRAGGGGGLIAADAAARAPADGHTLFTGTAAILTINPSAYKKLPYAVTDFAYICKGVEFPLILVTHPSVGVTDVTGLGAWFKRNPDKASYASYQPGTPSHFLGHQLGEKLGIPLTHIPYRGSAPQVTDLLGGTVQVGFTLLATALPHIQSGRLVPIATTGATRTEALPQLRTLAEQGLGDLTTTAWFGLVAPKGTPAAVVDGLIQAHKAAVQLPEVRARFAAQGLTPSDVCGADFLQQVQTEGARWAQVVKATGFSASE
jgi:tripartite-type tricarboxylate transporter receptor subunit TctC